MKNSTAIMEVADDEQVARIISKEWLDGDFLMPQAFEFAFGETYLSVNRIGVETYDADVKGFVESHPSFCFNNNTYQRALLKVREVRATKVCYDGKPLLINVSVMPRAAYTKSHAGIFVQSAGRNVVFGRKIPAGVLPKGVSSEMILQQVQWELRDMAVLQECEMTDA